MVVVVVAVVACEAVTICMHVQNTCTVRRSKNTRNGVEILMLTSARPTGVTEMTVGVEMS